MHRRVRELEQALSEALNRIASLERRADTMIRHGPVTDVDPAKHLARIAIGQRDGQQVKSAWVPYAQFAGPDGSSGQGSGSGGGLQSQPGAKYHTPVFVGQQLTLFSPGGEVRQAVLLPLTWSNQAQSPSQSGDEHVFQWGDLKVTAKSGSLVVACGDTTVSIDANQVSTKSKRVETVGKTYLGLDQSGDDGQLVDTEGGPAKQTYAKV